MQYFWESADTVGRIRRGELYTRILRCTRIVAERSNSIFVSTVVSSGSYTIIIHVYLCIYVCFVMYLIKTGPDIILPALDIVAGRRNQFLYSGNRPPSPRPPPYYVLDNILLDLPDLINKLSPQRALFEF